MIRHILCFDPGKTTGFALFCEGKLERAKELQSLAELVAAFTDAAFLRTRGEEIVCVYEGFARGNVGVKDQLQTIEVCGAIRALCHLYGFVCVEQMPAVRTGYIPIAKQMIKDKVYGVLREYHHSIDAIAHGLTYMEKEGIEWDKEFWISKVIR